jgi:hypothetical protein
VASDYLKVDVCSIERSQTINFLPPIFSFAGIAPRADRLSDRQDRSSIDLAIDSCAPPLTLAGERKI